MLVSITEFIATPGSSSKVTSLLAEVSTVSELMCSSMPDRGACTVHSIDAASVAQHVTVVPVNSS